MPEYLTPGVYIEEFEIGAKPIEGVSTSTAGFLGEAERGPTTPRLVTSWLDYLRVFGSYFGDNKYLPYAVEGFFTNGGQRCYIGRIVLTPADLATLKLTAGGSNALTVEAVGEGDWGNRIAVQVRPGTFGALSFKLSVFYWKETPATLYDPDTNLGTKPTVTEIFDNLSVSESSPDFYRKRVNGISNLVRLLKEEGVDSGDMPDPFANRTDLVADGGTAQAGANTTIQLAATASGNDDAYNGMQIRITGGTGAGQTKTITDYVGGTTTATVDSAWNTNPDNTSVYEVRRVIIAMSGGTKGLSGTAQGGTATTIQLAATASGNDDAYNGMQIRITGGTGAGQTKTITDYVGGTTTATVDSAWNTNPDNTSVYDVFGNMMLADYQRTDTDTPGNRKGLTGFAEIDEISIIYAPDAQAVNGLPGALINHCEILKDRFAIIDATGSFPTIPDIKPRSTNTGANAAGDTKYAAFYYPWIKVIDPQAGMLRRVPPGGHVAGIYARSDTERGVHKAPANEVVRGVADLEFQVTKGEQGILNPLGVNVIRAFPGRGIRVWGARTLSSDTLWKYINVRRLFIYVEESIEEGTQWVVFEPNDEKLWGRVRATITEFLTRVWRDGALMGTKVEEAFFVKCDRTTMTQDDIDNGRLICIIGIAPVKPAEFVIFRIAQFPGGSAVTE